jgi:CRISPR-associated protein Cas1
MPPVVPSADPSRTLYVDTPGSVVRKRGGRIRVEKKRGEASEEILSVPAVSIERAVLVGSVHCTSAVQRFFLRESIDVTILSRSGRLQGRLTPVPSPNVGVRLAQYEAHSDADRSLAVARSIVKAKLRNLSVLLQRRARRHDLQDAADAADRIRTLAHRAASAADRDRLRGLEGQAGRIYFGTWRALVRRPEPAFYMERRTRRPPEDAVNALLGFTYALLESDVRRACVTVGLDPYIGFLHRPRHGCPSCVLDLMEAFRPIVADAVALRLVNHRILDPDHFEHRDGGTFLTDAGRTHVYRAYDRRRQETVTPPGLGTSVALYRAFEAQARLLARSLTEGESYEPFMIR